MQKVDRAVIIDYLCKNGVCINSTTYETVIAKLTDDQTRDLAIDCKAAMWSDGWNRFIHLASLHRQSFNAWLQKRKQIATTPAAAIRALLLDTFDEFVYRGRPPLVIGLPTDILTQIDKTRHVIMVNNENVSPRLINSLTVPNNIVLVVFNAHRSQLRVIRSEPNIYGVYLVNEDVPTKIREAIDQTMTVFAAFLHLQLAAKRWICIVTNSASGEAIANSLRYYGRRSIFNRPQPDELQAWLCSAAIPDDKFE